MNRQMRNRDECDEIWSSSRDRIFELNKKLVLLMWEFCKLDIENMEEAVGGFMSFDSMKKSILGTIDMTHKSLDMEPFRSILLKQGLRLFIERMQTSTELEGKR